MSLPAEAQCKRAASLFNDVGRAGVSPTIRQRCTIRRALLVTAFPTFEWAEWARYFEPPVYLHEMAGTTRRRGSGRRRATRMSAVGPRIHHRYPFTGPGRLLRHGYACHAHPNYEKVVGIL